ncbi:MAG: ComF family protein, partial [Pseudomonas sp.]|nr:ComF family protein [Pseudomonas sp.]
TGATAESLARLLKQAGAARVDVYCLARTPKPGD